MPKSEIRHSVLTLNTLVQPYQEICNTNCLFPRFNELQVGLGYSRVWYSLLLKKCFLLWWRNSQHIFYPQNKTHQDDTSVKKRGKNHLHKVSLSPSYRGYTIHFQNRELSLLCRVPAARCSAPLEVTVLCSSSSFWVHRLWGALIWERRGTYRNCKVPQTQI